MKLTSLIIAAAFPLILVSCVPPPPPAPNNAILCDVQSPDCAQANGFLSFENDTVQVLYVFWAENGMLSAFVHNKLSQPIYIDWKKGSFITGTTKHDYWDGTATMTTNGSANSVSTFWSSYAGEMTTNTFWSSVSTISRPERITFIPPGTTVSRVLSPVVGSETMEIDPRRLTAFDSTIKDMPSLFRTYRNYQGTTYEYDSVGQGPAVVRMMSTSYGAEDAPLTFRSFITYSTTDKFTTEAFIDNRFYVSRILEFPAETFNSRASSGTDHSGWATPHSFYLYRTTAEGVSPSPAL